MTWENRDLPRNTAGRRLVRMGVSEVWERVGRKPQHDEGLFFHMCLLSIDILVKYSVARHDLTERGSPHIPPGPMSASTPAGTADDTLTGKSTTRIRCISPPSTNPVGEMVFFGPSGRLLC